MGFRGETSDLPADLLHHRREGVGSKELDNTAYEVARANEIIATFDRMIVDEIQIDRYL